MTAQNFPNETPLNLPTASLHSEPPTVDLRPVLEALEHEYRLASEWGHTLRAAAYREALHMIREQMRKASAQQTTMSIFVRTVK